MSRDAQPAMTTSGSRGPDPPERSSGSGRPVTWRGSLREEDLDDVAVADAVCLSLRPQPAVAACLPHGPERHEIFVEDRLGADEAAGEVGVDGGRRVDGCGAVRDRPCPDLVRPGGEERDEPEQAVGKADHAIER